MKHLHPAVHEGASIDVPDERWGEAIKAIVVLRGGQKATQEETINFCKEHLASYKKPKSVEFFAEIPKNFYGKVLKRKLREKYWLGEARRVRRGGEMRRVSIIRIRVRHYRNG